MNARQSKKIRRKAEQIASINAKVAWEIVTETINRQKFVPRLKIAWAVGRRKL